MKKEPSIRVYKDPEELSIRELKELIRKLEAQLKK